MELKGKTALVTGGAVRVGRAICEALAAKGCRVVIHCNRSREEAGALAKTLEERGTGAFIVHGDLSSEAGCVRMIEDAFAEAGEIDILVNNASVFHRDPLMRTSGAGVMAEFQLNLFAPMFLMREFASKATARRIVNILDRRIVGNDQGCLPYILSKKALAELTRNAALELAPRITVNGVAPGPVLPVAGDGRAASEEAGAIPLERRPTPKDVAEALVFLVMSEGITGQTIFVDGGQHLL